MSFATAVGGTFAQALGGIDIGVAMIRYLYGIYEAVYVNAFPEELFLIAPHNTIQPTDCLLSGSIYH